MKNSTVLETLTGKHIGIFFGVSKCEASCNGGFVDSPRYE